MLPSDVQPLQQDNFGFFGHGIHVGRAHFAAGLLHSFHGGCNGSRLHRAGNGVYFRRRAQAELSVASPAIQSIQVRTAQRENLIRVTGR